MRTYMKLHPFSTARRSLANWLPFTRRIDPWETPTKQGVPWMILMDRLGMLPPIVGGKSQETP